MNKVWEFSKSNALLEIGEYWIEEYSKIEKEERAKGEHLEHRSNNSTKRRKNSSVST